MYHYVVKHPFGNYPMGAHITDPAEAAAMIAAGHERNLLRILAPVHFELPAELPPDQAAAELGGHEEPLA